MLEKIKDYLAKYGVLALFILIIGAIGTILFLRWQNLSLKSKLEKEKTEVVRLQDNYDASIDTISVYRDKNGNLTSVVKAYKLEISELNGKYNDLFKLYVKEKNKEPIVIIEYRTKIDEKITNISTVVSDTSITFIDSVRYSEGSYRSISGNIPYKMTYHIKKDMVNKFSFEKALYFAYILEEEHFVKDAEVVAFKDDKIIKNSYALKDKEGKNIVYRIKIIESQKEISLKDLSDKYKIDQNIITSRYSDGIYTYYAGNITPSSNIEPIVEPTDIDIFGKLFTNNANLVLRQGIQLNTSLVKDKKTNKVLINVKSDYPGLIFTNVIGADIMSDPISRKVAREFRKEYGIGLNVGYGFFLIPDVNNGYIIKRGPEISVGLNWTPKFLQFGK
jgi:uncharacterized LabA/DUF88 family protein